MTNVPPNKIGQFVDNIEETSIALCLGLMTLITFANVIARYIFNGNILWALEITVFLFAWLILMGASYAVKKHIHIGVDVVINMLAPGPRKILALIAWASCMAFSILLLIGSWDYWYPFITERVWLETEDIPMPEIFAFLGDWLNEGEKYEKIPRFIPYMALPLGMALITFRYLQVGWKIFKGDIDKLIAAHEVEDDIKELEHETAGGKD
ncbi:TRAP transporter small permease [uncultured Cocleimonas sp.]|uniref:TRAP transporter small permease n=1 Tax=uncultured Cocleimonas sp. TaxID=1051587 RepID=UPI00260CD272|nr:TRAP transporter small permease [uncultured Cocleimonas sp.]